MRLRNLLFLLLFSMPAGLSAQQGLEIVTEDIPRFWQLYDRLQATPDTALHDSLVRALYLTPGTPGLKAFSEAKGYAAADFSAAIRAYPRYWASVRANTLRAAENVGPLAAHLQTFKRLYPALHPAKIYFTIGALRSGGTTLDQFVLIGAELAAADSTTDVSDFPADRQARLRTYLRSNPIANLVQLNVHEYVHTQQKRIGYNLLSQSIFEGVCDFVAERITGDEIPLGYNQLAPAQLDAAKTLFEHAMCGPFWNHWLYNAATTHPLGVGDLGYRLGFEICAAYYAQAPDKTAALADMIELDYGDSTAVEAFVDASGYFPKPLAYYRAAYTANRPRVVGLSLPENGAPVPDTLTTLTVYFSAPLSPYHTSLELGEGGKAHNPIAGFVGFSDDRRAVTYRIQLKPNWRYSVVVSSGFRTPAGLPLVPYTVWFRTE